jgi:GT2 family glycosyltransferase
VPQSTIAPTFNGYGCNMALRLDVVRAHALRFDERLPLYAWYEDIDLCRRLASHGGEIVEVAAASGVHLGVKHGRTSGKRLGYSQVVNPLYLWRKGSYPLDRALRSIGRHLLINGVRSLRPEPWVDRRGRLVGNSLALLDIMRGRAVPERILDL